MILPCLAPQQADRATCPIVIKLYASHTHETGRTGAQAGSSVLHWTDGAPALLSECACLVTSPHRRRRRTFMEERLRTAEEALRLGRGIKACEEMRVRVLTQCITWSHLAASIKPAAAAAGAAAGGVRAARTSSRRHLVLPPLPDIEEAPDLLVEPTKPATPAAAAVLPKEEHKVKPSLAWLLALAPSGAAEGPITEARPPAAAHNTLIIEFDRSASLVMTLVMGGAGQDCVAMITPGVLPYTKLRPGETRSVWEDRFHTRLCCVHPFIHIDSTI